MDTAVETEFDFSAAEVSESEPVSDVATCQTPGCHNPLTYGGRGPRPKYCSEHKRKTGGTSARTKKRQGTDYTPGITGLLQLAAVPLTVAGAQGNPAFLADAKVITVYSPGIAEALNDLAQERPEVAAVLDRVLKAGPYGALIAAIVPMTCQILANHKIVPPGVMGTVPMEQVLGIRPQEVPTNEEG
jgi:hypothetical protein